MTSGLKGRHPASLPRTPRLRCGYRSISTAHAYTTMLRNGGQIKLVNLTTRVQDLLAICRLSTVFESFDSEAEALQSYAGVTTP